MIAAHRIEHLAEGVTLFLGDCREILPTLEYHDALISDPPYGVSFCHSGGGRGIGGGKYSTKFANETIVGDDQKFNPGGLVGVAPKVILWGGNHFASRLPDSSAWLIWDKRAKSEHSNNFADGELAWTNLNGPTRIFRHHWDGMMRASERGIERMHPTQKPIALMEWCIQMAGSSCGRILDAFMGSGTTGVAAVNLGCKFTGIEIEPKYFDIAADRISDALKRPGLFVDPPPPVKQESLL